jgi:hypothetical protein
VANLTVRERAFHQDGKLVIHRQMDMDPVLESNARLRAAGAGRVGEMVCLGRVPTFMVSLWLQEAGVDWSDSHAVNEVIKRKLESGEFAKFRISEGEYR